MCATTSGPNAAFQGQAYELISNDRRNNSLDLTIFSHIRLVDQLQY